jgi:hypothetical protein
MSVEFGIVEEHCPFCDQEEVVRFSEHYYFCPGCMAIYTFLMVLEKGCDHITKDSACVEHEPWYETGVPFIKTISGGLFEGQQVCSKCGAHCVADGW